MKLIFPLIICLSLSSCTYSITMVHTQGEATDIVDETQENTPSTTISIPVKPI